MTSQLAPDLPRLIATVRGSLDQMKLSLGPIRPSQASEWFARHRAALQQFADWLAEHYGARISEEVGCTTRVRLAGITASSTSGLENALRNWIAAAEKHA